MMDWNNPTHVAIALTAIVLIIVLLPLLIRRRRPKPKPYDASWMVDVFQHTPIQSIRFVRSKIAIDFVSIESFDPQLLQDAGAKGISIVGDTVKFYVDGGPETNEALYQELKRQLER
jgi:hypothetical protein